LWCSLMRQRDWACRAALPLFQPNSNHLVKAKEGRKTRCLPKRDHPPNTRKGKRTKRTGGCQPLVTRPPSFFIFIFLIFSIPRVRLFFFFLLPPVSLYKRWIHLGQVTCRWWAHTIYCMYTWEFDFVRPNCPPISYSRPPSSAFLGREIKGFHRSFSRLKPNLTLWKDDGVGFVNHASFGIDGTAHKFAPPAANFQTFQITSRASLWYYVTVKVRPVSLFIPSIDY
jgi:hypothetical protein